MDTETKQLLVDYKELCVDYRNLTRYAYKAVDIIKAQQKGMKRLVRRQNRLKTAIGNLTIPKVKKAA